MAHRTILTARQRAALFDLPTDEASILYHYTLYLGQAVAARQRAGLNCEPALLAHISPLGWAHILLTGEYRWRRQAGVKV